MLAVRPDGSAYLMHHGVKGMKWGVRKQEDRNAAYKRGERYSGAQGRAFVKREKLTIKANAAKKSGDWPKYSKLNQKVQKADYKYERAREFKNWGKSGLTNAQRNTAALGQLARGYAKASVGSGLVTTALQGGFAALSLGNPYVAGTMLIGSMAVSGVLGASSIKNAYRGVRTFASKPSDSDVNIAKKRK